MSGMGDWEAKRARQALEHDEGAGAALIDAAEIEVRCGAYCYCYGGSAKLDVQETLAELHENGWRLTREVERDE